MTQWIIKSEDTTGKTRYLLRVRPTKWTLDKNKALKLDRFKVARESEWLNFIGQSHKCEQYYEE